MKEIIKKIACIFLLIGGFLFIEGIASQQTLATQETQGNENIQKSNESNISTLFRGDARILSTSVAKSFYILFIDEYDKNGSGLRTSFQRVNIASLTAGDSSYTLKKNVFEPWRGKRFSHWELPQGFDVVLNRPTEKIKLNDGETIVYDSGVDGGHGIDYYYSKHLFSPSVFQSFSKDTTINPFYFSNVIPLYAKWTNENAATIITYDGNGRSDVQSPLQVFAKYNLLFTPAESKSKGNSGEYFKRWSTQSDDKGHYFYPGNTAPLSLSQDEMTLYAQYQTTPTETTINYNDNGHSLQQGLPKTELLRMGDLFTAPEGEVDQDGYVLTGWNTRKDGSGVNFTSSDATEWKLTQPEITLYAQWEIKDVVISFDGNGNSSGTPPETIKVKSNQNFTIPEQGELVKSGKYLKYWSSEKNNTNGLNFDIGKKYTLRDLYGKVKKNTQDYSYILYAYWDTAPVSEVWFDNNFDYMKKQYNLTDKDMWVAVNSPYRENLKLNYWHEGNVFKGDRYATYGTKYMFPYSHDYFSVNDYYLDGWNTKPDGTGTSYPIHKVSIWKDTDSKVTLYAQWKYSYYTQHLKDRKLRIVYDKNGATFGSVPPSQEVEYKTTGTKITTSYPILNQYQNVSVKNSLGGIPGYVFDGWNTEPDGSGETFEPGVEKQFKQEVVKEELVLYAKWKKETTKLQVHIVRNDSITPGTFENYTELDTVEIENAPWTEVSLKDDKNNSNINVYKSYIEPQLEKYCNPTLFGQETPLSPNDLLISKLNAEKVLLFGEDRDVYYSLDGLLTFLEVPNLDFGELSLSVNKTSTNLKQMEGELIISDTRGWYNPDGSTIVDGWILGITIPDKFRTESGEKFSPEITYTSREGHEYMISDQSTHTIEREWRGRWQGETNLSNDIKKHPERFVMSVEGRKVPKDGVYTGVIEWNLFDGPHY